MSSLTRTKQRQLLKLRHELQRRQDERITAEPVDLFVVARQTGTGGGTEQAAFDFAAVEDDRVVAEVRQRDLALRGGPDERWLLMRTISQVSQRDVAGGGSMGKGAAQLSLMGVGRGSPRPGIVHKMVAAEVKHVDQEHRRIRLIITATKPDRDGEVVVAGGARVDAFRNNPIVLFSHNPFWPVGNATELVLRDDEIEAEVEFFKPDEDVTGFADPLFRLYSRGKMKAASIGFLPIEVTEDKMVEGQTGRAFVEWELLEFSLVSIPSLREALTVEHAQEALVKFLANPTAYAEMDLGLDRPERLEEPDEVGRWNRTLSKAFEAHLGFEPATAEYALASKYLKVEVKELHQGGTYVPSPKLGSFLSALEEKLQDWVVEDVRNLNASGEESPLVHEVIQLNSQLRSDFLVHGIRFMRTGGKGDARKMVLKVAPDWYGLVVTTYTAMEHRDVATLFLSEVWTRAQELNYLRGEAFSLSGEFLEKTGETWNDVFLTEKNEKPLKRAVALLNEHGAAMENRGILLTGPPGTGKTLAGRVMMNEAQCTFIWLSARDFWRSGAFGGLDYGFELARECAPTILFIEDVDNWLSPHTIDLLKTQMDGIGRSAGVVTVLTTNFPELLPEALLDRPGRFHDVLRLDLPTAEIRLQMLAKWLPDLKGEDLGRAVKETHGYSGAHLRELARFVRIIAQEENLEISEALTKALEKLREQRQLITDVQTSGSRYRPSKAVQEGLAQVVTLRITFANSCVTCKEEAQTDSTTAEIQAQWQAWIKSRPEAGPDDTAVWEAWLKQRPPTTVQSVVCSKDRFDSAAAAKKWCMDHDFRTDKVDETDTSFRFRQFDPGECRDGSFRTITLTDGVSAVICRRKDAEAAAEAELDEAEKAGRVVSRKNLGRLKRAAEEILAVIHDEESRRPTEPPKSEPAAPVSGPEAEKELLTLVDVLNDARIEDAFREVAGM